MRLINVSAEKLGILVSNNKEDPKLQKTAMHPTDSSLKTLTTPQQL